METNTILIDTEAFTVDEAEHAVYSLDSVINILQLSQEQPTDKDVPDSRDFVLESVLGTRNKLHAALTKAGVKLDYPMN